MYHTMPSMRHGLWRKSPSYLCKHGPAGWLAVGVKGGTCMYERALSVVPQQQQLAEGGWQRSGAARMHAAADRTQRGRRGGKLLLTPLFRQHFSGLHV